MNVFDASALLAFVASEAGAEVVEAALADEPRCSAANWSEVAQKVRAADRDWGLVRGLLLAYEIRVEPVTVDDAEWAAQRWTRGDGLSLADRLCLALAERLDTRALTADTTWGTAGRVRQIR
jgi:PIN domain nuclease of toxin-antitoxin system